MAAEIKSVLHLEGADAVNHTVSCEGSMAQNILSLKEHVMEVVNKYIAERHLETMEVDVLEEVIPQDDEEDDSNQQKKSRKGNNFKNNRRKRQRTSDTRKLGAKAR